MPSTEKAIDFKKEEISKQMRKILKSSEICSKTKLCNLLQYIVNETLDGRKDNLKGYTIGVDVFGKEEAHEIITRSQEDYHQKFEKLGNILSYV